MKLLTDESCDNKAIPSAHETRLMLEERNKVEINTSMNETISQELQIATSGDHEPSLSNIELMIRQ